MTEEEQLMLSDCEHRSRKLGEWELTFIDSLSRRDSLSPKQSEKLEEIWGKVTSDG